MRPALRSALGLYRAVLVAVPRRSIDNAALRTRGDERAHDPAGVVSGPGKRVPVTARPVTPVRSRPANHRPRFELIRDRQGALLDPKPRARATKTATNFSRYAQAEPEVMSWD